MSTAAAQARGPGCPRCWTPLLDTAVSGGAGYCGECNLEFTAVTFHPPDRPVVTIAEPAAGAPCALHGRNAAVAACQRCGAFMCSLCRVEVDGRSLCAACFGRGRADGTLDAAQTTFRSWRTLGIHLALVGILLYPAGVLVGPASLFASTRGIAQSRKAGDEGGMVAVVLSMVLAVLITVASGFFIVLVIGALVKARK
jgi:hypothetical protein